MASKRIDYEALHEQVVQQCARRGVSRRTAAAQIGIPPGTFTRVKNGQGVSGDTFVSLMNWLGRDESIRPFLRDGRVVLFGGAEPSDEPEE